jgi:hypothetical protein
MVIVLFSVVNSVFDLFAPFFQQFGLIPPPMLPTTHTKTSQIAQTQLKQATVQYDQIQKAKMVTAVNDAVLEYSITTGKKIDVAWQELFTVEHLSW